MDSRIEAVEEKLNQISYRLDFHDQTNETQLKSFNELTNAIQSSKNLDMKFIEKFELMDLLLKNKDSEIEILNTEIRTLNILIETINLKLSMLE